MIQFSLDSPRLDNKAQMEKDEIDSKQEAQQIVQEENGIPEDLEVEEHAEGEAGLELEKKEE